MILIKNTDDYLYELKRDIFVLSLRSPHGASLFGFDRDDHYTKMFEQMHINWFNTNGISYAKTCPPGVLMGWLGHYYVGFESLFDPKVKKYSEDFEVNDKSKHPGRYQLQYLLYTDWVSSGKLIEHEQHLTAREDPNYEW
jgi:hypothetical protein